MRNPSEWIDEELSWEPPEPHQSVLRFTVAIILLSVVIFCIGQSQKSRVIDSGYEVLAVSKGALQVVDRETGEHTELRNRELVRKALSGQIRRGDVVYE